MQRICEYYGSVEALKKYYQNFLEWDGSLNEGLKGPEVMFYFTNRDAFDGGDRQPFGLVGSCANPRCKIQVAALAAPLGGLGQETTSSAPNKTFSTPTHSGSQGDESHEMMI